MENGSKKDIFKHVLKAGVNIISKASPREQTLSEICQLLSEKIDYYDWVGFYLVDSQKDRELVLGPYVGAYTDHDRIAFGQGICGQAAETEETFVIQDVRQENNYLACSLDVRSEIVVPIFANGKIVGELDIDSHKLSPFDEVDQQYLEQLCRKLSILFE